MIRSYHYLLTPPRTLPSHLLLSSCGSHSNFQGGYLIPSRAADAPRTVAPKEIPNDDPWKPPFKLPICQLRCGVKTHQNQNKPLTDVLGNLALFYKICP